VETLKNSAQFDRVRREGRSWSAGALVLNAARNDLDVVRCGFITGKKVGKAVRRNRARRLIREAVRLRLPYIKPGWDLAWIARPPIVEADFASVRKAVDDLLARGHLLREHPHADSLAKPETPAAQSRIIDESEDTGAESEDGGTQIAEEVAEAQAARGQQ
jgi:ribonuclease P protein component